LFQEPHILFTVHCQNVKNCMKFRLSTNRLKNGKNQPDILSTYSCLGLGAKRIKKHDCSLLCSRETTSGPYLDSKKSSPHLIHYFLKIHLNITLLSTPRSPFRCSNQNFVYTSSLPYMSHALPISSFLIWQP
jgi:hypothetical protein